MRQGMRALILLADGSSDPGWIEPFSRLRRRVATLAAETLVMLAYLEHTEPSFAEAADVLTGAGATEITVVPLFLGPGIQVRTDVPRLVDEAATRHPQVKWTLKPFVGDAPEVMDAIAAYALR
jgi:sirohydrochlorin cobaltochelatase